MDLKNIDILNNMYLISNKQANKYRNVLPFLTKNSFSSMKKLQPSVKKCECKSGSEENITSVFVLAHLFI